MTTNELIKTLSKRLDITQREAKHLMRMMFDSISDSLEQGETMVIRGFGTFGSRLRKPRKSYHPTKKKLMILPPKQNIYFRPSQKLRKNVAERVE